MNNQITNNPTINYYNYNNMNQLNYFQLEKEKEKFNNLLQIGLKNLSNKNNINNYLFNNNIQNNNYCNYNNINHNINNICNNNNFIINNHNSFYNQNIQQNQINQNNQKGIISSLSIREKTKDPSIEKISTIEITTYVKNHNNQNMINVQDIMDGKESRTWVKVSPIPPNYTSFDICKLIDSLIKQEKKIYNAIYTPHANTIKDSNKGFCFINFVNNIFIIEFYFQVINYIKNYIEKNCEIFWADNHEIEFLENIRNKSVENKNLDFIEFYE